MKQIAILPTSKEFLNNALFDLGSYLNRDNCLSFWNFLQIYAQNHGLDIQTIDRCSNPSGFLALDINPQLISKLSKENLSQAILFCVESPTVLSRAYRPKNLLYLKKHANRIFHYNKDLCKQYGFEHKIWHTDVYSKHETNITNFQSRKDVCLIATQKWSHTITGDLNFRLRSAQRLAEIYPNEFQIYGFQWNCRVGFLRDPLPRIFTKNRLINRLLLGFEKKIPAHQSVQNVYMGPIKSKGDALKHFRANIIFENTFLAGYLCEKIFDAIQYGCIPIYYLVFGIS